MGEIDLPSNLVDAIEGGEQTGTDPLVARKREAGKGQADQVECRITHDGEIGVDDGGEASLVDQQIAGVQIPVHDVRGDEVLGVQPSPELLDSRDEQCRALVVAPEGTVEAVVPAANGQGLNQGRGPARRGRRRDEDEALVMEVEEAVDGARVSRQVILA